MNQEYLLWQNGCRSLKWRKSNMKHFFTIEELIKIEGFATPVGVRVRHGKLYSVYGLPKGTPMPIHISMWEDKNGHLFFGEEIKEYAVYNDPCDPMEIPEIKRIIKATQDDDGYTINLIFDDLSCGAIDYADNYCRRYCLREMSPYASLILRLREVWNDAVNPIRVQFLSDGERFHVGIEVRHGNFTAFIPVSNISLDQKREIQKYV